MSRFNRIADDFTQAMKARDKTKINSLKMLKSELKNKEIELMRPLTDDEIEKLIRSMLKKRQESIEMYEQAGRLELAEQEKAEFAVLQAYLPAALSDDELMNLINTIRQETGSTDFGTLMKATLAKVAGRADGKRVSDLIRRQLG